MIVKMNKVSIVVIDRFREQSLKALRRLGSVSYTHLTLPTN